MDRMPGGVDADVGGKLAVITDPDHAGINDGAVVVGKKVLSDLDAESVITVKRRVHKSIFRFREKFLYDRLDAVKITAVYGVELLAKPSCPHLLFHHRFIGNINQRVIPPFNVVHSASLFSIKNPGTNPVPGYRFNLRSSGDQYFLHSGALASKDS